MEQYNIPSFLMRYQGYRELYKYARYWMLIHAKDHDWTVFSCTCSLGIHGVNFLNASTNLIMEHFEVIQIHATVTELYLNVKINVSLDTVKEYIGITGQWCLQSSSENTFLQLMNQNWRPFHKRLRILNIKARKSSHMKLIAHLWIHE